MSGFVQSKGGAGLSNGGTLVMPNNVVAGNHIIILLNWTYLNCPPSFSDGLGNTYTAKESGSLTVDPNTFFFVFTAPITTGGACTITLSASCAVANNIFAAEVSGLITDPFDKFNCKANSANPCDTGSVTPSTDGQYIAALFYRVSSAGGFTARSGFTKEEQWNSSNDAWEDKIQSTAAAIAPDMDAGAVSSSYKVFGYVATFKMVAATGKRPMRVNVITPSNHQDRNIWE